MKKFYAHNALLFLKFSVFALLCGATLPSPAYSHGDEPHEEPEIPDAPENFPQALTINGKPIEPLCFTQCAEAETLELDITDCSSDDTEVLITKITDKGFVETQYGYKGENGDFSEAGLSGYKPLGMLDDDIILQFYDHYTEGGGMKISGLALYKRDGNKIVEKEILTTGDQCNGGLANVAVTDASITYSKNLTPYDIFFLSDENTSVIPYTDIEASNTSCFATANYRDAELINVNLAKEIPNKDPEHEKQYEYQACYNQLHEAYVTAGMTSLTPQELTTFTNKFEEICLNNKENTK